MSIDDRNEGTGLDATPHIIVHGNPVDGLWFEGPYADSDEALAVAERDWTNDWWIAPLYLDEQERADEALGERNAIVPPAAADRAEPRS